MILQFSGLLNVRRDKFFVVIPRRQNILSDVKHQVKNLVENAKKTSQRRKTAAQTPPLFAFHMHAVIDI